MSKIASGSPQGIRLRGEEFFVWWGEDSNGDDRVESSGRGIISFTSRTDCVRWAAQTGLAMDAENETSMLDCDDVTPWLTRAVSTLDYSLALDVVNMSIDVSNSIGESWDPRYGQYSPTYDKFFAASVPWFFQMDSYAPRWSAHQLAQARSVVQRSLDVLSRALGDAKPRATRTIPGSQAVTMGR